MSRCIEPAFICLLLLISLVGVGQADEAPGYFVYVQGGDSSITNGSDGMTEITVKDIIANFYIANGMKSILHPVERLTKLRYPLDAAMVFSGADNESVSMVTISNLSLSEGDTVLTLQVTPMKYYEGEVLKSFTGEKGRLDMTNVGEVLSTGIYMEMKGIAPENEQINLCEWEPWNC